MLEVVTFWAPRKSDSHWREGYLDLLALQGQTVKRVGHRHRVVTDAPGDVKGYDTVTVELPGNLMKALTTAQLLYVRDHWSGEHPLVLVDVDCLVAKDLNRAFDGSFDIGLASRENGTQPIQNGAMYFAPGAKKHAARLFERTLDKCEDWWGSDQVALAVAVAPVPRVHGVHVRHGARIAFLPCETYNFGPKTGIPKNAPHRFILHFKGDQKKYAAKTAKLHFLLPGSR